MVVSVLINFHPWFKFYFPLFLGMVLYENVSNTKGKYILQSKQFKCTPEDCTNESIISKNEPLVVAATSLKVSFRV